MEQTTDLELGKRTSQQEQNEMKEALRIIGMVRLWVDNCPQHAAQLAFELNQVLGRYVSDPSPDIELRVHVPLAIWKKWVESRDVERAETLLLEAMMGEIEKRKQ